MARRRNGIAKRNRPRDLKRITNARGERVWITGGKEYATLAQVNDALKLQLTN